MHSSSSLWRARDDGDRDAVPVAYALAHGVRPVLGGDQFDALFRKASARQEIGAVVYQGGAIADEVGQARQGCADVPCAADDQARLRLDALEQEPRPAPLLKLARELVDSDGRCLRA